MGSVIRHVPRFPHIRPGILTHLLPPICWLFVRFWFGLVCLPPTWSAVTNLNAHQMPLELRIIHATQAHRHRHRHTHSHTHNAIYTHTYSKSHTSNQNSWGVTRLAPAACIFAKVPKRQQHLTFQRCLPMDLCAPPSLHPATGSRNIILIPPHTAPLLAAHPSLAHIVVCGIGCLRCLPLAGPLINICKLAARRAIHLLSKTHTRLKFPHRHTGTVAYATRLLPHALEKNTYMCPFNYSDLGCGLGLMFLIWKFGCLSFLMR